MARKYTPCISLRLLRVSSEISRLLDTDFLLQYLLDTSTQYYSGSLARQPRLFASLVNNIT